MPKSQDTKPVTTYEAILGQVLRQLRDRADLGQVEMAKLVGVTQPYWSKVEIGKANPSHAIIRKAAEIFGISHASLIAEVDRCCIEAKNRGVSIVQENQEETPEWLPYLGAAALGALIAIVLSKK